MHRINKSFVDHVDIPEPIDGKPKQVFYRDTQLPGFALRVTSGGSKSFVVEKRINNRVKRVTLGKYGHLTVEQARKSAMRLLGDIAQGKDPDKEKRLARAQGITLEQAFEDYLLSRKNLKPSTVKNYKQAIYTYLGDWQYRRLMDINKDMVASKHREIGKRSPAKANNAMRVLRAVYNHAMDSYDDKDGNPIITLNPVARISRIRGWYRVERRTRYLKPHQLHAWYQATQSLNNEVARDYLHLILFTGLRAMEGASLTWEQVDLLDRTLTIPDTKNRDPHTLPLSTFLQDLLKRRNEDRTSDFVFPSKLKPDRHLRDVRTANQRVTDACGIEFSVHDLRRSFVTYAESLDIPAYALKRLLNHRMTNDVTAGYIITDVERLRAPMQKVSNFLIQKIANLENF